MVSRPAKVDVLESHSGAETMPVWLVSDCSWELAAQRTILDEDVQALLDEQGGVEDDQTEAERQDVVAGPDLEKGADGLLFRN